MCKIGVSLCLCLVAVVSAAEDTSHLPLDAVDAVAVYKQVDEVALRLLFVFPEGHKMDEARPAAVFFFGGGWNGGSPEQFLPQARYLASRGMVGVLADYRVKSRHATDPFVCVEDGKSALRWLRAHAGDYGIDAARIAGGGGSAGGHVAAATGTIQSLDAATEDQAISSRANALLLFNPVFDNGPKGYGYDRVAERYEEISPLHNIAPGAPPTIVFLGSQDKLIPVATAEAYRQKMEAVGARCDLHVYEDQAHGFFNEDRGGGVYYQKTVRAMDAFLVSLGYLAGEAPAEIPLETARGEAAGGRRY